MEDLTGQRFGRLVVIGMEGDLCHCRCDCGGESFTRPYALKAGHTVSCGCYRKERAAEVCRKDYTGHRFGRLTVLGKAGFKGRQTIYHCRCDCGKEVDVSGNSLVTGNTRSCGCLKAEVNAKGIHGGSKTRVYTIWTGMIGRCQNKNQKQWKNYGGKGIRVCDEWRHNFPAFREWAYSHGYEDSLTIDRIDSSKGYSPDNCQWITRSENTRRALKERYSKGVKI